MTNTNQAFIEAYERTASQQAASQQTTQRPVPFASQTDSSQTVNGPHFQIEEKAKLRGPLSDFLSHRIVTASAADGSNSEANLQANLGSNRTTNVLDIDAEALQSTFEVTNFRWPTAAIDLSKSARDSMIGVFDQVISSSTNVLALSSARQEVGLTTTTLAFALAAIESGMKVAMIDLCHEHLDKGQLDPAKPLTQSLGLSKMRSLREASALGMSLGEAIVTSQNEQASLLSVGGNLEATIASAAITRLSAANDFVLIDAGIVGAPERSLPEWIEPVNGSALLVDLANGSRYDAARIAAADQLSRFGSQFLGVIENLV